MGACRGLMRKKIALLLGVILAVLCFAACGPANEDGVEVSAAVVSAGTDGNAEESPEAAADDANTAQGADADAQGETLKRIIENGKLVLLTNAVFPPFEYRTSDGQAVGIDIDLGQAIADQIGVELEIVDMEFGSLIPALTTGKGDVVIAGVTISDERKEAVDFSDEYAESQQIIIVPAGETSIASQDDLKGKKVGVQIGTTGDIMVTEMGDDVTVTRYNSPLEAAMDLQNGRIDAVVIDELPARNIVAKNNDLDTVVIGATDEHYGIAIQKNNEDFLEIVNGVVADVLADGTLEASIAKHNEAGAQG